MSDGTIVFQTWGAGIITNYAANPAISVFRALQSHFLIVCIGRDLG